MSHDFVDPLTRDNNGKDELDDILGLDLDASNFIEPSKEDKPEIQSQPSTQLPVVESEDPIPKLVGEGFPIEYVKMADRIRGHYAILPKLDYDEIDKEISDLSVKSCPTPTLQVLNDEIQKVQSAKDRLSEIFIEVIKVYNYKKRAVDILQDAWGKFTSEKNAEGRKGDSAFRISEFVLDLARTEGLLKSVTHIFRNLDSMHDGLSRRITIWQLTMKLHDFGRSALPDYDFDKTAPTEKASLDIFSKDEQTNKEGEGEIKLEGF